jgi:hypothetical protein
MYWKHCSKWYDQSNKDNTCSVLIHSHGIIAFLVDLLKVETDRFRETINLKADFRLNLQILHAIVGALKNLALAECDRSLIGSSGTIDKIAALLEFSELKLIHHSCLSILKNLCGGHNG